jgi:hypothetical protein
MSSQDLVTSEKINLKTESSRNYTLNNDSIGDYVREFKKEVETKYLQSFTNKNFKFPRKKKTVKKKYSSEKKDSFNSLDNLVYYDLKVQDIKRTLLEQIDSFTNYGNYLALVIKKIGCLNIRYLETQFQSEKSCLFKIILKAIRLIKNNKNENFSNKAKKTKNKVFVLQKKLNQTGSKISLSKNRSNKKENCSNPKKSDREAKIEIKENDHTSKIFKEKEMINNIKEKEQKAKSKEFDLKKIKYILKNKELYLNIKTKKNNSKIIEDKKNSGNQTSRTSLLKNNKNVKSSSIKRKKSITEFQKCLSKNSVKPNNGNSSKSRIIKETSFLPKKNKNASILDSSVISRKKNLHTDINKKNVPMTFTKDQLNSLIHKNFNKKNSMKKYIDIQNSNKKSFSKINLKKQNLNSLIYK